MSLLARSGKAPFEGSLGVEEASASAKMAAASSPTETSQSNLFDGLPKNFTRVNQHCVNYRVVSHRR